MTELIKKRRRSKRRLEMLPEAMCLLEGRWQDVKTVYVFAPASMGFPSALIGLTMPRWRQARNVAWALGSLLVNTWFSKKESIKITLDQGKSPESLPGKQKAPKSRCLFSVFLFAYLQWCMGGSHWEIHGQRQSQLNGLLASAEVGASKGVLLRSASPYLLVLMLSYRLQHRLSHYVNTGPAKKLLKQK